MMDGKTLCVVCAWRSTCNKKFLMDGATTTKCPDFTRDVTLKETLPEREEVEQGAGKAAPESSPKKS
jgi:hypothetical protein